MNDEISNTSQILGSVRVYHSVKMYFYC